MIHVLAVITAKPGMRAQILAELLPRIPEAEATPGCIEYRVAVDTEVDGIIHQGNPFGPDTFVCIEKWESLDYLRAHSTSPGPKKYLSIVSPLTKSRVVHFLTTATL